MKEHKLYLAKSSVIKSVFCVRAGKHDQWCTMYATKIKDNEKDNTNIYLYNCYACTYCVKVSGSEKLKTWKNDYDARIQYYNLPTL